MKHNSNFNLGLKTTRCRWLAILLCLTFAVFLASCGSAPKAEEKHEEEEAIAVTEFTDRIENFFEYSPLHVGKPSQFLIHLTDLTDGSPVEKAEVTLKISPKGSSNFNEVKSKIGRVTGIYVAEVQIDEKGLYDIEFHVKNEKLNEKMPLKDFEVK
jgi:5-hydroxyisourate hydrolase-like protein (transthyretin family)